MELSGPPSPEIIYVSKSTPLSGVNAKLKIKQATYTQILIEASWKVGSAVDSPRGFFTGYFNPDTSKTKNEHSYVRSLSSSGDWRTLLQDASLEPDTFTVGILHKSQVDIEGLWTLEFNPTTFEFTFELVHTFGLANTPKIELLSIMGFK